MKHLKEKGNVSRYFTQKNITRYILLFVIFVLAAFVRLYQLTELPWGIHIDEAGLGVNAYSLAKCGVDRYLNSYPIYPKNFYGGQSPFYTYLVVLFIKLFNHGALDLFIVRFPMVLLSLLAYLAGSCIIKKLFGSKWHIFGSFLYAVMPYFMMQARMGLDCNALVSMLTISLLILIKALEKNKYYRYVILGFFWGLTYYTYALSYISDTLALLLISVYCLYTKKTDLKKLLVTWVIAFMMTIPLILMIAVNAFGLPDIMLGKISLFKMDTYRGTQFCFHPMSIIKNIPTVLKVSFFQDGISYSSFDHFFTMYIWSLPFFVMGAIFLFRSFVKSLKAREYQDGILFLFVYVAHFSSALFLGADAVPQIHRINGIFFSQLILVLYGIYGCANGCSKFPIFKRQEKLASKIKGVFVGTVAIVYLVSFVLFAEFYFLEYKRCYLSMTTLFG